MDKRDKSNFTKKDKKDYYKSSNPQKKIKNTDEDNKVLKNIDISVLDSSVKSSLKVLGDANRQIVAKYVVLALENFESNRLKDAVYWASKAVKRAARIAYIRQLYGVLLYYNGDYRKAVLELGAFNRLSGKSDLVYIIADCYRAQKKYSKAIDIIKEFINSDLFLKVPKSEKVETYIVYASIRIDTGDSEYANVLFSKAKEFADGDKDLLERINSAMGSG